MNNLKELRKKANLSQEEVANKLGSKQASISEWESGKKVPSLETVIQLSRIFSVSIDCIVGFAPIPDNYPNHISPVQYTEVVYPSAKAAENTTAYKPTKKAPFTDAQIAYLDEWGQKLIKDVADEVVVRLQEDSSLLKETGNQETSDTGEIMDYENR